MEGGALVINYSILTAVVIGLVEVAKKLGMSEKFAPLLALILGLGFAFMDFTANADLTQTIVGGIIIGLSAVGLYSGTKNVIEGIKNE